jgi:hypothetical protein
VCVGLYISITIKINNSVLDDQRNPINNAFAVGTMRAYNLLHQPSTRFILLLGLIRSAIHRDSQSVSLSNFRANHKIVSFTVSKLLCLFFVMILNRSELLSWKLKGG